MWILRWMCEAGPRPRLAGMTNSTTTLPSAGFPSPQQRRGSLLVKKVLLWGVVSAVAVAGVLALLTFTYLWRSPNYYDAPAIAGEVEDRIVGQAEYSEDHDSPFTFRAGNVVVFGAEHMRDPNDPQIALIDKLWDQLDPTVALVEGRLGFLAPGFMDPVEKYGESGHVLGLAKKHDADAYTWEMPEEELVAALAERHPKERVALFMVLRPYFSNLRNGKPDDPEAFVEEFLARAEYPSVAGPIADPADIDRIWDRDFPAGPDWRDVSDEHGLPGYLQDVSDSSNDLRNRHLVRVAVDLAARGERVFVVAGSSHAVLTRDAFTQAADDREDDGAAGTGDAATGGAS
jgi:hypothetical protein